MCKINYVFIIFFALVFHFQSLAAENLTHDIDRRFAISLTSEAREMAREIDDSTERAMALTTITTAHANLNDFYVALKSIYDIRNTHVREELLRDIAITQAEAGFMLEALTTIRTIESSWPKASALIAIAEQPQNGDQWTFLRPDLITEALEVARQIASPLHRSQALSKFALTQDNTHLFEEALDAARGIETEGDRSIAFAAIASAQAKAGLFHEALNTADDIVDALWRAQALGDIAASRSDPSVFIEALQLARGIETATSRSLALQFIASAHNDRELFIEARDAALDIAFETSREMALSDIATAQANAGFLADARQTASQIETEFYLGWALGDLAFAHSQAELHSEALRMIQQSSKPLNQIIVLSAIARSINYNDDNIEY
ncbi:hypothetical protein [Fodinicurvata sp. EGI_FJ10296]|uniref:hypothetical protein n=1 Tax=Fodinicurvata sp. EGI_FJ10296 TaxID=3231908 RepID=UPI003455AB92